MVSLSKGIRITVVARMLLVSALGLPSAFGTGAADDFCSRRFFFFLFRKQKTSAGLAALSGKGFKIFTFGAITAITASGGRGFSPEYAYIKGFHPGYDSKSIISFVQFSSEARCIARFHFVAYFFMPFSNYTLSRNLSLTFWHLTTSAIYYFDDDIWYIID